MVKALAPESMDSYALLRCLPKTALTLKEQMAAKWESNSGLKTDKFDVINDVVEGIELQDSYKS